jgi:hypothetical protein
MSGGHYNYQYHALGNLADDIERDFVNEGKCKNTYAFGEDEELDRIGDATAEQRPKILGEVAALVGDLRAIAHRARELEWYMSGDTGADSYLTRLAKLAPADRAS